LPDRRGGDGTRASMTMGLVMGKRESTTTSVESGLDTRVLIMTRGTMRNMMRGQAICPSCCSSSLAAPRAA
jgi:hypothetical protein